MPMKIANDNARDAQTFLKSAFYNYGSNLFERPIVREAVDALHKFSQLNPKEASILRYLYLQNMKLKEVSNLIGYSIDYTKRLHREALEMFYPYILNFSINDKNYQSHNTKKTSN
jgi:DNA-directed RNA polymerase specialized sigma24 family protein